MNDFLGKDISIDDRVVFIRPCYRELKIGVVVALTPQKVRILPAGLELTPYNTFLQEPNQIVKI